jgi:hypothetical protein
MVQKRSITVLLAVLLPLACSKEPGGPSGPTVAGQWAGNSGNIQLFVNLKEDGGGTLTGTGTFVGPTGGSLSVAVNGSHNDPQVQFRLTRQGFQSAQYTGGRVNDSTITGTIAGSGFQESMTLRRQ